MKILKSVSAISFLAVGLVLPSQAVVLIDETFDAGYARTTQDILNGNMAVYKSRTATTATVASDTLAFTGPGASSGADMYFAYFTDPAATVSPYVQNGVVALDVGHKLSVSLTFKLPVMPSDSSYSLRFGLFDQNTGSRQTADLGSGGNSTAFTDDLGYMLNSFPISSVGAANAFSFRYRSTFTTGNILSASGDYTTIGSSSGGAYTGLASDTFYVFNYTIERQDATTTILSSAILSGDGSTTLNFGTVTQVGTPATTNFSWIAWRPPGNNVAATFDRILVEASPIPEPSTLALAGLVSLVGVWFFRRQRA